MKGKSYGTTEPSAVMLRMVTRELDSLAVAVSCCGYEPHLCGGSILILALGFSVENVN